MLRNIAGSRPVDQYKFYGTDKHVLSVSNRLQEIG